MNKRRPLYRVLLPLWFFAIVTITSTIAETAFAAGTLTPINIELAEKSGKQLSIDVGKRMQYLEDPTGRLSFEDVSSPSIAAKFKESNHSVQNFGLTSSIVWVRFAVRHEGGAGEDEFLLSLDYALVETADAFFIRPDGKVDKIQGGLHIPLDERPYRHFYHVFPYEFAEGVTTVYMRVQTSATLLVGLTLWGHKAFHEHDASLRLIRGIALGAFFILVLSNLLMLLIFREKTYFFLLLFILSFGLWQLNLSGLVSYYLWSDSVWWSMQSPIHFVTFSFIFGLLFVRNLLDTQNRQPALDKLFQAFIALSILIIPFAAFDYLLANLLAATMGLGVLGLSFFSAWTSWRQGGYRPALYFLWAYSAFILVGVVFILAIFGIWSFTDVPLHIFHAMFVASVLLFSFAITERIERARAQALSEMEAQVEERTATLHDTVQTLKREVEQRKIAQKHLSEREELLHLAFQTNPDCFIISKVSDGAIVEVNDAFLQLSGYTREEVIGKPSRELGFWEYRSFEHDRTRIMATLQEEGFIKNLQFEVNDKFGKRVTGLASTALFMLGDEPHTISAFRDMTEQLEVENERQRLELQLKDKQRLESLAHLAGGVAHDFNNLLTGILGNLNFALMEVRSDSPLMETLSDIQQSVEKAAELAKKMLAFSGKGHFFLRSVFLMNVIEKIKPDLRALLMPHHKFQIDCNKKLPSIQADKEQIAQALANLVTNAAEAIDEEEGEIHIRCGEMKIDKRTMETFAFASENLPVGDAVYVEVEDNGEGMTHETLKRIFDPFYSTRFTGRGLGMAAVLGIIRGHSGAVMVRSEREKGSLVRLIFPVRQTDIDRLDENFALPKSEEKTIMTKTTTRHNGVLIVDDEAMIRSLAARTLERFGFHALTAADGDEAVRLVQKEKHGIDCIILDYSMPKMSGAETMDAIRKLAPDIPIILTSGYNDDYVKKKFKGKGLQGSIQKPFQPFEFIEKIQKAIKNSP